MNATGNGFQEMDIDGLLDAEIDDLPDLPPFGIPPSGHYNLAVTVEQDDSDEKRPKFKVGYTIEAINALSDKVTTEEAAGVAVGQKFMIWISPFDKDGKPSERGFGAVKEFCASYMKALNTRTVRETLAAVQDIHIAATVTRRPNKKDPEFPNGKVADVVVL